MVMSAVSRFVNKSFRCLPLIPALALLAGPAPAADFDFIKGGDVAALIRETSPVPKTLSPLPASEPLPPQPVRNWTVMVYMSGKNDLTFALRDDLNEMEEAGSTPEMNVVAELGHIGPTGRDWPVSRVFVRKDDIPRWISSPALETRDGADMGDWRELAGFIKWSKTNFPARKYMLIISGHGSGWDSLGKPSSTEKGISFDDQSGRHIDSQGLRLALEAGGGVDVYAADACLMQMTEVAYEIRKNAGFIVGSEEAGPGSGYQYRDFLLKAASTPDPSPKELAAAAVEAYVRSYASDGRRPDATHSYIDSAALDGFIPLLNDWVAAAMDRREKKAVERAIKEVKLFSGAGCADLLDLLRLAGIYARTPELRSASERAREYAANRVVGLNMRAGAASERVGGLSIYVPWNIRKTYLDLQFARDSQWDEFILARAKTIY